MPHLGTTQILDPDDSDAAVVGQVLGARGDVNYEEHGSVPLEAGQLEIEVSFVWEKETDQYVFDRKYVADPNGVPEDIRAVINEQTKTGFKAQLSAAPDTSLSTFYWKIETPDPLHITQPPTSQPRYVLADDLQPLSENLTALSGLVLTGFGSGFLSLVDEAAARDYIGAIASGDFQPANAQLTALSILPVQAFGLGALNIANAADFLDYIGASSGEGAGGVPTTRTITEGAGLAGNTYDLSANRTLAMGTPSPLTVSSTNLVSGTTHSHGISSSSNPGAAASILATNAIGQLALVDLLASATTFNLINTTATTINFAGAATALAIGWSASGVTTLKSPTVSLSGTLFQPVTSYNTNIGSLSKKFLAIHAAELWVETLVAQDTLATVGGRIIVPPSTTSLIVDLAAGGTTIDVKHNSLASGDTLYMEEAGKVEFMAVTSAATTITGGYRYSVTRNLDGTGANDWFSGDAVVNTGTTGSGFIDLYSLRGVKSANEAGPTIVGNVRQSATYNDWKAAWAIGNLKGLYGIGIDSYGAGFGLYGEADKSWAMVDDANGFRAGNNTTTRIQLATDGSGFLANSLISWDTSGNLTVNGNATIGGFSIGSDYIRDNANSFGLASTVTGGDDVRFWAGNAFLSRNIAPFRVTEAGALTATNATITGAITASSGSITGVMSVTGGGSFEAGGGQIKLNSTGLKLEADEITSLGPESVITWLHDSTTLGKIYAAYDSAGGFQEFNIQAFPDTAGSSNLNLSAKNSGAGVTLINANVTSGGVGRVNITGSNLSGVVLGSNLAPAHMLDVYGDGWFQGGLNATLPTSDPGVVGRLWRSGADVKVSI